MLITISLFCVWVVLMLYSGITEFRYYQSVKTLEPALWQQLGAPRYLRVPMVFVSPSGVKLLKTATNKTVIELAHKHRQAGLLFLAYVVTVLLVAIIYFKLA